MTGSYRQIDHTGDIGIEANAPDEAGLFACCAEALFDILSGSAEIRTSGSIRVEVEAEDRESLMVLWLRELLYLHDARGWMFGSFDVVTAESPAGRRLTATARGEAMDPARHRLGAGLKAVTYHQIEVARRDDGTWRARVIFDA